MTPSRAAVRTDTRKKKTARKLCQAKACREPAMECIGVLKSGAIMHRNLCRRHADRLTKGKPIVFRALLYPVSLEAVLRACRDAGYAP